MMLVTPILPGPTIITNPTTFPPNIIISKYIKKTTTSQQARYNHPYQPLKLSGLVHLKSPVEFAETELSPGYAEMNEVTLETMGTTKKISAFLNSDKRQHSYTAAQDLHCQFK